MSEQYPTGLGRTVPELAGLAPANAVHDKVEFSCFANPALKAALSGAGRQTVLFGIEAHVCVSQTAHDLLQNGYQVQLLSDAVSTRLARNREVAINKIARAGAVISSVEMALFELFSAGTPEFKQMQALVKTLS